MQDEDIQEINRLLNDIDDKVGTLLNSYPREERKKLQGILAGDIWPQSDGRTLRSITFKYNGKMRDGGSLYLPNTMEHDGREITVRVGMLPNVIPVLLGAEHANAMQVPSNDPVHAFIQARSTRAKLMEQYTGSKAGKVAGALEKMRDARVEEQDSVPEVSQAKIVAAAAMRMGLHEGVLKSVDGSRTVLASAALKRLEECNQKLVARLAKVGMGKEVENYLDNKAAIAEAAREKAAQEICVAVSAR